MTACELVSATAAIIGGLTCGLVYVDGDGRIRLINRKAETIFHVAAADVLGKRVDMLPLRTPLYRVLSEDCREAPVEVSVNGAIIVARCVELKGDGLNQGDLYEFLDVTEEKKEKRHREEIVAMMTHDLKSPLTVMMGYVQALKSESAGKIHSSLMPCLDEMERSSHKLLSMIEDVLDAYRLEVGLLQITCAPSDIGRLLEACCSEFAREANARGSELIYSIGAIPSIEADGKQLTRVFANLIGNAVKFTPRHGRITVEAVIEDRKLYVCVRDTGIGIPEKDLPKIFNKYFRAGTAHGFKGTGLGLTISKAIVEAHGGTITVESVEGEGSCFTVILPTHPAGR